MSSSSEKPRVLIFGGTGFVARHLVKYLVSNELVSKIRVVDKILPALAYLSAEFKKYYESPIVEFKQINLSNGANTKKAFVQEEGSPKFKYVINLAAETRYGLDDNVYKQMVLDISVNGAREAAAYGVDKFVEVSTAQVYEAGKKSSTETSKVKPWTKLAKYKAQAEEEIKKMGTKLPFVILRPATIYGPGDMNGLCPRIICASTYTTAKQQMKLLWTGDLRIDTVFVTDVVHAIWHSCVNAKPGSIFNLADKGQLTQKKLNEHFHAIFGIETGFWGSIFSSLAQLKIKEAAETANETHMNPWSEMLKSSGIKQTPLSPYIDVELLYNTPLAIDGSAIEETGFKYDRPEGLTQEGILEEIQYWKDLNLFPEFQKRQ